MSDSRNTIVIDTVTTNDGHTITISLDKTICFLNVNGVNEMLSAEDVRSYIPYVLQSKGFNFRGDIVHLDLVEALWFAKAMRLAIRLMELNAEQVSA